MNEDRASYLLPNGDGRRSWVDMPEAEPRARCRVREGVTEPVTVRVDYQGRLVPSDIEAVDIDRYKEDES